MILWDHTSYNIYYDLHVLDPSPKESGPICSHGTHITRHNWSHMFLHAHPTRHISISCPQPPRCVTATLTGEKVGSHAVLTVSWDYLSYRLPCALCACGTQTIASDGPGPVPYIWSVIGQGTETTPVPPSSPSKACFRAQMYHCPKHSFALLD